MAAEEGVPPSLNYISEVVLKKRKNNEQWAIRRKLQLQEKAKRFKSNKPIIKKPEQFIREFRDRELDFIRLKNRARQRKRAPETLDSKLLFVIRIGGKNDMHPETRKILYSLRLRKIFSGVFVKANEGIMKMFLKVEPHVTFGYPNLKSVKDMIYKKGVVRIGKERIPLTDNNIIEQELGQHGIICIEDIITEIANVGPRFKVVTDLLCPFVLNKPEKALSHMKRRFADGGDSGNRKDLINELLGKMN